MIYIKDILGTLKSDIKMVTRRPLTFLESFLLAGIILLYGGFGLNGLTFWANNGRVPVRISEEVYGKGIAEKENILLKTKKWHQPMTDKTRLNFFADRFSFKGEGFSKKINVFSIGDLMTFAGIAISLAAIFAFFVHNFLIGYRSAF